MRSLLFAFIFMVGVSTFAAPRSDPFYSVELKTLEGKKYSFSNLKGKSVLIVNTASKCGFAPQLKELQALHTKYGPKGLVVLAIPSNDFKQEGGTPEEIISFNQKEYKTTFLFLEKQTITGIDKSPLFKYLTAEKKNFIFKEVQWNFEKFLVGRDGQIIDRWSSITKPLSKDITHKIEASLM